MRQEVLFFPIDKKAVAGYFFFMKKILFKLLKISGITAGIIVFCLALEIIFPPLCVGWTLILGDIYHKAGQVEITISGKTETHTVYKAKNKPFILIHFPFRWDGKIEEDFLFVNPKQVIATATDGGGDAWFRIGPLLFIFDDMTSWDRVRLPFWDYLEATDASVGYDAVRKEYVYKFKIHEPKEPAILRVCADFFTPDLLAAPNDTL